MGAPNGLLRTPEAIAGGSGAAPAPASLVGATIDRYSMLAPGCRVLAAVSGGRDSTALALLLHALGYRVVVGHVDHAMRPGSEKDAAHCEAFAASLGAPFLTVRLPYPPLDEATARRARYGALEQMANRSGADRIATGHTLDDVAETVAMRLGRGGAAIGIPPRRGRVVRPLIAIRRRDTEAVCRAAGAAWVDDPTNADERHRRNRLRRHAMPALRQETAARLAAVGTANVVVAQARRADAEDLATRIVTVDGSRAEIDRTVLRGLPPDAARAVVRLTLDRLGIDAGGRAVGDVVAKVVTVTGAGLDLPGGMRAWSDAARVVIGRHTGPVRLPSVPLVAPGRTVSPEWGLTVVVEEAGPTGVGTSGQDPLEAVVDASAAAEGLVMRQRRPGDRFVPVGAPGATTLQDLFVNLKVPREDRERVPVVTAGNEILWVAGLRLAERWKAGARSERPLRIRLTPSAARPVAS